MTTPTNNSLGTSSSEAMPTPAADDQTWSVGKILTWSTAFLKKHESPTPRLDAEILIAHILGCSRIELYTTYDKPLAETERRPLRELIRRRSEGEPVAYLVGYRDFFQLRFLVTPDVLIPRPDTEVVVEQVLKWNDGREGTRILDVGVGSGCIGISIGQQVSGPVTGWDLSPAALAVAEQNAEKHGVEFTGREIDMRSDEAWQSSDSYDVVVANPPYVRAENDQDLAADVARYEPALALYGGADGLDYYRVLAANAGQVLAAGGLLALEIGHDQAAAVTELLAANGWQNIQVVQDYGDRDRVILAERESA